MITTSDVDREIRVTALQSGAKPDFGVPSRRATAERLVEQKLIRREMELSHYLFPDPMEAEPLLEDLRMSRFANETAFREALAEDGITEQDLKDELLWQLTMLRFIEVRFRPGVHVSDQEIEEYFQRQTRPAAEAANPGQPVALDDFRDQIEETLAEQKTDQVVDDWLREARKRTEIVVHEEAFR